MASKIAQDGEGYRIFLCLTIESAVGCWKFYAGCYLLYTLNGVAHCSIFFLRAPLLYSAWFIIYSSLLLIASLYSTFCSLVLCCLFPSTIVPGKRGDYHVGNVPLPVISFTLSSVIIFLLIDWMILYLLASLLGLSFTIVSFYLAAFSLFYHQCDGIYYWFRWTWRREAQDGGRVVVMRCFAVSPGRKCQVYIKFRSQLSLVNLSFVSSVVPSSTLICRILLGHSFDLNLFSWLLPFVRSAVRPIWLGAVQVWFSRFPRRRQREYRFAGRVSEIRMFYYSFCRVSTCCSTICRVSTCVTELCRNVRCRVPCQLVLDPFIYSYYSVYCIWSVMVDRWRARVSIE